jgi:hypothetical protein
MVDRWHDEAAAKGVKIVPCCGYDSIPSGEPLCCCCWPLVLKPCLAAAAVRSRTLPTPAACLTLPLPLPLPADLGTLMLVEKVKEGGRAVSQVFNCIGPGRGGVSGGTIESGMNMQVGCSGWLTAG